MSDPESKSKWKLIALGLLVVFAPALILVVTLEFLLIFGGLAFDEVSLIELVELYIIEVVLFAVGAYILYRILLYSVGGRVRDEED